MGYYNVSSLIGQLLVRLDPVAGSNLTYESRYKEGQKYLICIFLIEEICARSLVESCFLVNCKGSEVSLMLKEISVDDC